MARQYRGHAFNSITACLLFFFSRFDAFAAFDVAAYAFQSFFFFFRRAYAMALIR